MKLARLATYIVLVAVAATVSYSVGKRSGRAMPLKSAPAVGTAEEAVIPAIRALGYQASAGKPVF